YVIHKQRFKQVLADICYVGKQLPEQPNIISICLTFEYLLLSLPLPFRRTVEQFVMDGTFLVKRCY
ncbi:MAG: hypothetical protein IJY81_02860, partial [Lachnospiraceae bacterium]|nr:hypothetical protein [Lachnospiraceae bacterium]